jgi:hypothetical protein
MMGGLLLAYYCTDLFTNKCMKRQMWTTKQKWLKY